MNKISVAVTGGIGSGKSTVIKYIKTLGYPIFSCDEIYKEIIERADYIKKVKQIFPMAITNGKIDRQALGKIVFKNPKQRKALNELAHPLIMHTLQEYMENCASALVFAEVPLLFEENLENQFDKVIVVFREEENRIDAVQKRDGLNEDSIKKRIQSQFDYSAKENEMRFKNCNAILIKNDQSIEELHNIIKEIIKNLKHS